MNCRKTPIERIVPEGIQTSDGKIHEVDVIVLAVGFDAGSGALSRIDIRGRDGRSLKDRWKDEIRTAMGLQVHGYPNLFTTGAPLAPSAALCNMTTCLQQQVDWIADCIAYARENGKHVVEATKEFEDNWVKHHDETAAVTLVVKTQLLVHGLERRRKAAASAGLHRRRRQLQPAVRRTCSERLSRLRDDLMIKRNGRKHPMSTNPYYGQEGHGPYELIGIGNLELEEGGNIRGLSARRGDPRHA